MDARKRKVLLDFIRTYKCCPELWDLGNKDYTNRTKKSLAYDRLIEKLRPIEPNATRDSVVRKINSLRSNYRKEVRKVEEDKRRRGCETVDDMPYTPTLWYYYEFQFLEDAEITYKRRPIKEAEESADEMDNEDSIVMGLSSPTTKRYEFVDVLPIAKPKREKRAISSEKMHAIEVDSQNQCSSSGGMMAEQMFAYAAAAVKQLERDDDEYLIMSKNYANKLKKMQPLQRLYADRIINDVLLEGQLGNLDRYTTLTTSDENDVYAPPGTPILFEKIESTQ